MPELPDIEAYRLALQREVLGERLECVRLGHPFLLRTVQPPLEAAFGRRVVAVERLGKRLVIELEGSLFLVLHLMIAGRVRWRAAGAALPRGHGLAAFDFLRGTLLLTEAGKKRRASLHVVEGREGLAGLDPGGVDVVLVDDDGVVRPADPLPVRAALVAENHTLKRALTDPHLLSGIGNAYSDEILHRARLSPMKLTQSLDDGELDRLHTAMVAVLTEWTERLAAEAWGAFPEEVTAFRPDMAVHGRYKLPCPVCGTAVQRIRYAENEADYCPRCQTEGRVLADRSLSRLLKDDWPRTIEELEARGWNR